MRVRALSTTGDWTMGKGLNDYKIDINAVAQVIETTLKLFLGDCFFAVSEGIDWFRLLGTKETIELKLIISAKILNIPEVTGIIELFVDRDSQRNLSIAYRVETVYGEISKEFLVGQ